MSASNAKAANSMPADQFFISVKPEASLYSPAGWNMTPNFCRDYVDITLNEVGSFGGRSTFHVQTNLAQYLGEMLLSFTVNPGSNGASLAYSGTNAWWDDFLTFAAIDRIELVFGTNLVQTIRGEELKVMYYEQTLDTQQRAAFRDDFNGPLPQAVRANRVMQVAPPNVFCRTPMFLYWTNNTHNYMPQTLGTYLRIDVYWRNLQDVRGSTGDGTFSYTVAPSITGQKIRAEAIYTEQGEAVNIMNLTAQGDGLLTMMKYAQVITPPVTGQIAASNGVVVDLDLKGINAPTQTLAILLRSASDVSTPDQINRWNFRGGKLDSIIIQKAEIIVSGGNVRTVFDVSENFWDMDQNRTNHYPSLGPVVFIDFGKHASGLGKTSGSLDFAGLANPILRLTIDNGSGSQFSPNFTIMAWTHNIARNKKGVLSRLFQ